MTDRPDIAQAVIEHTKSKIEVWSHPNNYASEAGHPCERYLVLTRVVPTAEKVPHDVGREFVFSRGRAIEKIALREIEDAGFEVVETQVRFEWRELQLTGHLDAKVNLGHRRRIPLEIKSINPYDFVKLNGIDDMLHGDKPWLRKYPAQLMLYIMHSEQEDGIFYLKNALNYWPKSIWITLDWDYMDEICRKLERVNDYVAKYGTSEYEDPPRCDDISVCERCDLFHLCTPEIKRDAIKIEDDEELIVLLDRREELRENHLEYNRLDKKIKPRLEGQESAICGDYFITGKWAEPKDRPKYWKSKIVKLGVE